MAGWSSTMAAETSSSDWRRVHLSRLFSETYGSTTNEYFNKYNSFEITKQIEPNVVSLSVYFMSESLVCYVAKFVFIMKKSAYENKIFR